MKDINQNSANVSLGKRQSEGKKIEPQMKRVFEAFFNRPKTMLMVEVETGILRPNICRYVSKWKKASSIEIVSLGICPISKYGKVQHLTTNPKLFQSSNQLNLF